jgi:hypothetical protein
MPTNRSTVTVVYNTGQCSALSNRPRASIQSIDRAAAILKALASGPRRLGVAAAVTEAARGISRELGAPGWPVVVA